MLCEFVRKVKEKMRIKIKKAAKQRSSADFVA
jgi:hypothetical protein